MAKRKSISGSPKYETHEPKLLMLTAYDYPLARLLDPFVDILLVGDSLACVVQGRADTLPVTLDQMVYHCEMVVRATQQSLVVGDMPFGTFHQSVDYAAKSAIRLVKEAGVHAVKIEGGVRSVPYIEALTNVPYSCDGSYWLNSSIYPQIWRK
jgi:3-methyl-2-oxobutanoate hydroxymethyltransferase